MGRSEETALSVVPVGPLWASIGLISARPSRRHNCKTYSPAGEGPDSHWWDTTAVAFLSANATTACSQQKVFCWLLGQGEPLVNQDVLMGLQHHHSLCSPITHPSESPSTWAKPEYLCQACITTRDQEKVLH